jgi:D-psicose/D-tagatose/L-ribulose 3-epimerase
MKIGFNLLLWTGHVDDSHLPTIEALQAAGYDGVEIPLFGGDLAHYQRLGQQIRDLGLAATAITIIPDAEHNPLSEDPLHRRKAVDWLAKTTEWAAALNSPILCGPIHQPLGLFTGAPPTDAEKGRLAEVHRAAAENAATYGIPIVVEYLNRFEAYILNTMADALAHAARVGHANFGVMHDTFHANLEEKDPVGIIFQAAPKLRHVHISENDRGTPGRGHVPFAQHFKALRAVNYDGWLTIEAFGRALPALAAATRVWRDFSPPTQVYQEGIRLIRDGWQAAGTDPGA